MSKMEEDLEQDLQDLQDMSRIFKISKIFRIFLSPSEQDQAIPTYREGRCMAAPVVRDRLIANGSRSGDPHLQRGL